MHIDALVLTDFLVRSPSMMVVLTVSWLSRNLGVFDSLWNMTDTMTTLHPILLTASKLRVAYFVDWHDHYVWIRVALILRDLGTGLVFYETSIEEGLTFNAEVGLFPVPIEVWTRHWRCLLTGLNNEQMVSVSAQRDSSWHKRCITVYGNRVAVINDWLLVASELI